MNRRSNPGSEAKGLAAVRRVAVVTVLLGVACIGCGEQSATDRSAERGGSSKLSVFVDSYPLAYFAARIGGDLVTVSFPAPAGVDPSFWSPDASIIARYQQADLVLVNGAGFASWIDTATLPGSRLVDTSAAIRDRLLPLEGAVTHSHGGMGEHSHAGFATMLWLDPMLAVEQATAIATALKGRHPESSAAFDTGLAALERDLGALDVRLASVAGRIGSAPLLFSHPTYAYLIHRYGLRARSLHWDPKEVPGHFALAQLDEKLDGHPAQWMVWEAEPVAETKAELEQRGIRSLVFTTVAAAPASGDYLSVMGENASRLEAVFP